MNEQDKPSSDGQIHRKIVDDRIVFASVEYPCPGCLDTIRPGDWCRLMTVEITGLSVSGPPIVVQWTYHPPCAKQDDGVERDTFITETNLSVVDDIMTT